MIGIALNFDLPDKLIELAGIHGMSIQSFYGVNNPIGVRLREVYFSILPLIDKLNNFEL